MNEKCIVVCLIFAIIILISGMPVNKSLYTVNYALLTSGSAGFIFCILYLLVCLHDYFTLDWVLDLCALSFDCIIKSDELLTCLAAASTQVDMWGYRWLLAGLEWMGVHSLSIFILLTSNLAIILLQGFYWRTPENNIVSATMTLL